MRCVCALGPATLECGTAILVQHRRLAMWYVRVFVGLLLVVIVVLFFGANSGERVELRWLSPKSEPVEVNLALAVLVSYVLGMFTFFLVTLMREIALRNRCRRLERELRELRTELERLRVAPLEGAAAVGAPREGGSSD